jgi:phage protein U
VDLGLPVGAGRRMQQERWLAALQRRAHVVFVGEGEDEVVLALNQGVVFTPELGVRLSPEQLGGG